MGGAGATNKQVNTAVGQMSGMGTTGTGNMAAQYGIANRLQAPANNFYLNRMTNGLPFYRNLTDFNSGNIAQAYAPIRADLLRRTSQYANQPSGYRDALLTSLGAQQGRAFDSTLTQSMMANELAKQQGAAGVTGEQQIAGNQALGYGSLGLGANQAVLNAPRKPSTWGTIGGMAQQGLQTAGELALA